MATKMGKATRGSEKLTAMVPTISNGKSTPGGLSPNAFMTIATANATGEQANRQNEQNDVPLEAARSHSSILGWPEHATASLGADRYKQVPGVAQ